MCRLIAFPPNFPRDEAIAAMLEFQGSNKDGVGSVHIEKNDKGENTFIVQKYPLSLTEIMDLDIDFLAHMPCDSWTVAHLRLASHGPVNLVNTHPFVVGPWAVVHNGCWSDYRTARIYNQDRIKLIGDTDSEVAANMLNILGPEKFTDSLTGFSGVFLGLNIDGTLWAMKSSGDLSIHELSTGQALLGSTLKDYKDTKEGLHGWYHFDKEGKYIKSKQAEQRTFMRGFYDDDDNWPVNKHWQGYTNVHGGVVKHNTYRTTLTEANEKLIAEFKRRKKGKVVIKPNKPWYLHKDKDKDKNIVVPREG